MDAVPPGRFKSTLLADAVSRPPTPRSFVAAVHTTAAPWPLLRRARTPSVGRPDSPARGPEGGPAMMPSTANRGRRRRGVHRGSPSRSPAPFAGSRPLRRHPRLARAPGRPAPVASRARSVQGSAPAPAPSLVCGCSTDEHPRCSTHLTVRLGRRSDRPLRAGRSRAPGSPSRSSGA